MSKVLMCGPLNIAGGVSTHTKYLSKCLSDMGVNLISYNLSGKNVQSSEGTFIRKLYQRTLGLTINSIMRRREYDIMHIQVSGGFFSFVSAISGSLTSSFCNKKIFITFHYRPSKQIFIKYKKIFYFILKQSTAFFVVSNKQKEIMDGMFPDFATKIIVISNGFDDNSFKLMDKHECRKKLELPQDGKILVSVGNLFEVKGHKYLIESIAEIIKLNKDVSCLIIGSGPLQTKIEQQIRNLQLENYVRLIGKKPHNEIPIWLNASDLFVLPSLEEGNPTVMFECLGCGKPFVGTRVGGIPEIINSEDYGLLCDSADPKDLEEVISFALNKKWDREKIRQYAERFTWHNISLEILKSYELF